MAAPSHSKTSNSFLHQFVQESCYPEELRESIISSLPREEGWVSPHIFNYKGFWIPNLFLYGALRSQQHFQAQDSDILLCTLPKCGTTWLKALIFALITRKHYFPPAVPQLETHPLLTTNPQDLIPNLEFSYTRENSPPDFPTMNNGVMRLISTHLPLALLPKSVGESKCKFIYLCRNQKDTIVSFWHFMNKLRGELRGLGAMAFPEAFDKYCRGESHFGPFWHHILEYWKESLENPSQVLFLKYEEIKEEPEVQLRRIAAFLGFSAQVVLRRKIFMQNIGITAMAAPSDDSSIPNKIRNQFIEEDSYPQELKQSIVSLPKEKGWLLPFMYNYKGVWLCSIQLYGSLRLQQHLQAQHSDIMLCTQQKSGTTWLKALLFALITRKQYFPPESHHQIHPLLTKNPHEFIPGIEYRYAMGQSPDLPVINGRRLLSTHLPQNLLPKSVWESKCKMVYLCRNQKDTLVSFWHFINKLRGELGGLGDLRLTEAFDRYCRGESYYGPFWDHILGYWKESLENPRKVLFLKYEEIKEEPDVHLKRIAAFLDCPFSEEEEECGVVDGILRLCSFESLSNLEVNKTGKNGLKQAAGNNLFFRKGKVGDWKNHMSDEMGSRLDQIVDEKFKGTGLKL
nr:cytosolic sulfotransferase 12-like [Ipomoea batatas]